MHYIVPGFFYIDGSQTMASITEAARNIMPELFVWIEENLIDWKCQAVRYPNSLAIGACCLSQIFVIIDSPRDAVLFRLYYSETVEERSKRSAIHLVMELCV